MQTIRANSCRRGFTLVEMMVGLTLLGVFMTGVFGSVKLSTLIAESTIYQNTAVTVAQGYLEQIKSLPYEDVLLAAQYPSDYPLETISPYYDPSAQVTVFDEPLSIDPSSQPNIRNITIDIRNTGAGHIVEMPMKLWVSVLDKDTGSYPVNALEINIQYAYKLPDVIGGSWIEHQVQAIRARL